MPKLRVNILSLSFALYVLSFTPLSYALNLDKAKSYILEGDYKSAISEGERLLAQDVSSDELYYILGISYLKDGNFLRASDIFEIILREFKGSAFSDEAKLGLGDTYFLRGDFVKAEGYYKDLINSNPHTRLKAQAYYRLSQAGYKSGNTQQGQEYLDKLKQDFPLNIESSLNKDLCLIADSPSAAYYTIQVGSFANITNARNLTEKLIQKGYPAYMEESSSKGQKSYRVRVGKSALLQEISVLENKLSREGYPTKICP
ncbi:MAG: SPOR domain-containing protein [Candidatus Omnitrophota bacterium]